MSANIINEISYITSDKEALENFRKTAKDQIDLIDHIDPFDYFNTGVYNNINDTNHVTASISEEYGYILLPTLPDKNDYRENDSVVVFTMQDKYNKWLETYIEVCRIVAYGKDAKYPCIESKDEKSITVRYNCNIGAKLCKISDIMYEVPKNTKFF